MAEPDVRRPLPVQRDHRRALADNRHVYAVVSRRSRGVSIGVNLNPDKLCNFDCVYCQVDRTAPGADRAVDVPLLCAELKGALDAELVRKRTGLSAESFHGFKEEGNRG
jgi:DNA repair photolyase